MSYRNYFTKKQYKKNACKTKRTLLLQKLIGLENFLKFQVSLIKPAPADTCMHDGKSKDS